MVHTLFVQDKTDITCGKQLVMLYGLEKNVIPYEYKHTFLSIKLHTFLNDINIRRLCASFVFKMTHLKAPLVHQGV